MRTKLFLASTLAVLVIGSVVFADAVTKVKPTVATKPVKTAQCSIEGQPCCTLDDCCEECIQCCSIDGCCEECIQCCIEMGCDPFCCFPALTSKKGEAPKKAEACCAAAKGCCTKPAQKKAKGCCDDDCCK